MWESLAVFFALVVMLLLLLAVLMAVLTMMVAVSVVIGRIMRRRGPAALRTLFAQAVDIERLGYQIADCASEHNKDRAAFFAAIHALPNYAQLHTTPAPAVSDEEKQLRLLVLNMQMHFRQTLRRLQARQATRVSRSERRHLRNEAARLGIMARPLLLPLYGRMYS
ncbi:MAG: hypothetical protein Q4D61_01090 [Cardiobacteriaceae bacterium]|nr:hypothetical protein [Cardiobacteriaceae bacterium]